MAEFEKTLIHFDENAYNYALSEYSRRLPSYQEIVDAYNALEIEQPIGASELKSLLEDPKQFTALKIMNGETLTVGGLTVKADKLFDMIEKPENYNNFIEMILSQTQSAESKNNYVRMATFYEVEDGETVKIKSSVTDSLKKGASVYINTEQQQEAYDIITEIVDKLNELKTLNKGHLSQNFLWNEILSREDGNLNDRSDFKVNLKCVSYF